MLWLLWNFSSLCFRFTLHVNIFYVCMRAPITVILFEIAGFICILLWCKCRNGMHIFGEKMQHSKITDVLLSNKIILLKIYTTYSMVTVWKRNLHDWEKFIFKILKPQMINLILRFWTYNMRFEVHSKNIQAFFHCFVKTFRKNCSLYNMYNVYSAYLVWWCEFDRIFTALYNR